MSPPRNVFCIFLVFGLNFFPDFGIERSTVCITGQAISEKEKCRQRYLQPFANRIEAQNFFLPKNLDVLQKKAPFWHFLFLDATTKNSISRRTFYIFLIIFTDRSFRENRHGNMIEAFGRMGCGSVTCLRHFYFSCSIFLSQVRRSSQKQRENSHRKFSISYLVSPANSTWERGCFWICRPKKPVEIHEELRSPKNSSLSARVSMQNMRPGRRVW